MLPATGWDCHVHVFDAGAPVRPGHYQPPTRTLAQIEARAAAHGIGHLVLVQPSVYGSDNTLLLRALQAGGGRHRGVVVLPPEVSDTQLDQLHAAGVRGLRFNRVSPVGGAPDLATSLPPLAPRLRARGWHVQCYLPPSDLPALASLQTHPAVRGLPLVLDHLAGLHTGLAAEHPAWAALARLAAGGAWVKLSGWYRLQAQPPFDALRPLIQRVAGLFGTRLVWGSDWPHTSQDASVDLPYASLWQPVAAALPPPQALALRDDSPLALYR